MKKQFTIHPILFALFPVLFLFSVNMDHIIQDEIYLPLAAAVVFACLLWLLLTLFFKLEKAAILTSLFLIFFFSYGHLCDIIARDKINIEGWALSIFILSFLLLALPVARTRRKLHNITLALNIMSFFLVALQIFGIISNRMARDFISFSRQRHRRLEQLRHSMRPNIYYIVLDAYARGDILEDVYKYNNQDFLNYLKEKNFYVTSGSNSNYVLTELSLASSLNFNYLDWLKTAENQGVSDKHLLDYLMQDNNVSKFLKSQGYTIVSFSTLYDIGYIKNSDIYIKSRFGLKEFHEQLMLTTPIAYLDRKLNLSENSLHRKRLLFALDYLQNTLKVSRPCFVYAHILCPHPPFVFDGKGNAINSNRIFTRADGPTLINGGFPRDKYREEYSGQLMFLNKRVRILLENIISKSTGPFVIILQSDHGPRSTGSSWEALNEINFKERTGILNAFYFSDHDYSSLYDTESPVNTFRIIFNKYFSQHYTLLPELSYYSTPSDRYNFIDITKMVSGQVKQNP